MRHVIVWVGVLVVAACGSDIVEGGKTADPKRATAGTIQAELRPTGCRDSRGQAVSIGEQSVVRLVVDPDGNRFVVDEVPGHAALVVENRFSDGQDEVFQAITETDDGPPYLREYRFGPRGAKVAVAGAWSRDEIRGGGFRGAFRQPLMVCELSDVAPAGPTEAAPEPPDSEPQDAGVPESADATVDDPDAASQAPSP